MQDDKLKLDTQTSQPRDELQAESLRPRPGFLVAGGLFALVALMAYLLDDGESGQSLKFVIMIMITSICAFFCLLCYRNPRIGNRLLGFDVVLQNDEGIKEGVHYTGSFKSESGLDAKRQSSRRMTARQTRRQLARATREMQAKKATESNGEDA